MKRFAIGTDIGGSHISCAVIDFERKSVLKESFATQKVNNQGSAEEILSNWATALRKTIAGTDRRQLAGIGFAVPGPFDYARGIALFTSGVAKYQNLYGINVSERLEDLLGRQMDLEVRFLNDAIAFGVGEAWMGKASRVGRSISVTVGTGLGAAFVEHGIPVVEREDVPPKGTIWDLPFNNDLADASFSTRWFIKRYAEKSGNTLAGAKQVALRAATDSLARDVFLEFGRNLGLFLKRLIQAFGAELLVIGGNVSAAYDLFGAALEDSLRKQQIAVAIEVSELKEDAALIGSTRLFEDQFWRRVEPLLAKM
jgi:glucokinase